MVDVVLAVYGAHVGIQTVVLFPLAALGFMALRKIKRQGDPVRSFAKWFHIALWLLFMAFLFSVIAYSVYLGYYTNPRWRLAEAFQRLAAFANLFFIASNAALLVCTAELAIGAKLAAKQVKSRGFRIFIFVIASLVSLLMLAYFIYSQHLVTTVYNSTRTRSITAAAFTLIGAITFILLLIGSIAVAVFALIQRRATHKYSSGVYGRFGNLVAVIAGVNLILLLWSLVVAFILGFEVGGHEAGWIIADAIISTWGTFALLVLIYIVGAKRNLYSAPVTKRGAPEVGGAYNYQPQAVYPVSRV